MLNKLKRDFGSTTGALEFMFGRRLPLVIKILYYIIMFPLGLLLYPFAKIWQVIIMRRIKKGLGI